MKRILIIALIIVTYSVRSQPLDRVEFEADTEKVYVHTNNSLYLTGEYLYYKVNVVNSAKRRWSRASTIIYVELIDENLDVLFKHKVLLKNGQGHSDYFIPNSVTSGNYKLLAYTPNMISGKRQHFFEMDIGIVNPYQADQTEILSSGNTAFNKSFNTDEEETKNNFSILELLTRKTNFGKREKVEVIVNNNSNEMGFGSYSVSVNKKNTISGVPRINAIAFKNDNINRTTFDREKVTRSREGNLLRGKISNVNNNEIANIEIALSIPGNDFIFDVQTTNALGEFAFPLNPSIENETALLQILHPNRDDYEIDVAADASVYLDDLVFNELNIDATIKRALTNRSIHNQIENAYYEIRPDTIQTRTAPKSFVGYEKKLTYHLDDFTRFPTLEEVFTEYAKFVWTSRNESGDKVVKVFQRDYNEHSGNLPLLFVDGILVYDHTDFLAIDARTIEKLTIIQTEYRFGNTDYQGVVLLESDKKAIRNNVVMSPYKEIPLFTTQPDKTYYKQEYSDKEQFRRVPDYREQLVWLPSLPINSSQSKFSFYTSDVIGEFEITIEGFTNNGEPISIAKTITVEQ